MREIKESPFDKHLSNSYFEQELLLEAKISGWKFDENRLFAVSKVYLHEILISYSRELIQWGGLGRPELNKKIKVNTISNEPYAIMFLLIMCTEKVTA